MKYIPLIAVLLTAGNAAFALDDGKGFEWIVQQGLQPADQLEANKLVGTIRGMPDKERADFLAALVADTLDFAARKDTWKSQSDPKLCIYLLGELGSDQQKLKAFRNPEDYGHMADSAARALATSTDPESVAILTRMAEAHLVKMDQNDSGKPQWDGKGQSPVPPSEIFFGALFALNESTIPDATPGASRLLDQFNTRHKDDLNDEVVAWIDKELEKARKVREKRLRDAKTDARHETSPGGNSLPGQLREPASTDAVVHKTPDASGWPWVGLGGGILALATAWLALKKRGPFSARG